MEKDNSNNDLFDRVKELIFFCTDNGDDDIFKELYEIIYKQYPEIKIIERIKLLRNE